MTRQVSAIPELQSALLIGVLSATGAAALGSAIVFAIRQWLARRVRMKLVLNFVSVLALVAVWILSAMLLVSDGWQPRGGSSLSTVWVHPGPLLRGLPLISIAATWLILRKVVGSRESHRRAGVHVPAARINP